MKEFTSWSDNETRATLLMQVRSPRNVEAWKKFVDLYTPLVYRYCRRRDLQEADVHDIVQEVFARVVRGIRSFEYNRAKGRFRGWLGTITSREIARHIARQQRSPRAEGGEPATPGSLANVEDDPSWDEEFSAQVLDAAIENLRPEFSHQQWEVFRLAWDEERSAREIAQQLNKSPEWVYTSKYRVVERLKREVAYLAEDLPALQMDIR